MQAELKELQTDQINASWNHIQDISNYNNSITSVLNPISNILATQVAHGGVPASRPALADEAVTLKALGEENLQRRSAAQQADSSKQQITKVQVNIIILNVSKPVEIV